MEEILALPFHDDLAEMMNHNFENSIWNGIISTRALIIILSNVMITKQHRDQSRAQSVDLMRKPSARFEL